MQYLKKMKRAIFIESILLCCFGIVLVTGLLRDGFPKEEQAVEVEAFAEKKYIKWVDFNVSYEALCEAYKWDVDTYKEALEDPAV